jgi:hypothetical protein
VKFFILQQKRASNSIKEGCNYNRDARNVENSTVGKTKLAATPAITGIPAMPVIAGTSVRAWTQAVPSRIARNSRDAEF